MPQTVTMPKLGLTMTQGTITAWLKKEGDSVAAGDTLCEIETDKITAPVESPVDGVLLKILASEFEKKEITAPLCIIGKRGARWEDAAAGNPEAVDEQPAAVQPASEPSIKAQPVKRVLISPVAKRLAEENDIQYASAAGSGPDGRIEKKDIERLLEQRGGKAGDERAQPRPGATDGGIAVVKRIPLTGPRKVASERLTASKHDIPHVYFKITVDASSVVALKESVSLAASGSAFRKPTLNDILVKAAATALAEFPEINASLIGGEIVCYSDANIGIAVNTGRGLFVPVIGQANRKSLQEISTCAGVLISRAREGKLTHGDMSGGTFTISNLGALGIDEFSAVINPPQAAILAVGRVTDTPCALNGGVFIRPLMRLTLSVDHRVIDGALAARFLKRLKEILEMSCLG